MYKMTKFIISTLLVVAPSIAFAAPGDLDITFNPLSGVAIYDSGAHDYGISVAVQDDGRIVVLGNGFILRYNANGSLDAGFGTGGVTTLSGNVSAADMVLQDDGRILIAGSHSNRVCILRYNIDASLDAGFGTGGVATFDGGVGYGRAIALQDDGGIVVACTIVSNSPDTYIYDDIGVLRYNTDGSLDTSFGTNGLATYDVDRRNGGSAVAVQEDGRIIVVGRSGPEGSYYDGNIVVLRYNTDGSLDSGFGTDGVTIYNSSTSTSLAWDFGNAVAIQDDGRIIVAGDSGGDMGYGEPRDILVLRYNTDGVLDTGFGTGGVAAYSSGSLNFDRGKAVSIQEDGRIVVGGYSSDSEAWMGPPSPFSDIVILRYNTDGSLDTGFGTDGAVIYDSGGFDSGVALALQDDGRIIITGSTRTDSGDNDVLTARFSSSCFISTAANSPW